jgi:hypothetical protein
MQLKVLCFENDFYTCFDVSQVYEYLICVLVGFFKTAWLHGMVTKLLLLIHESVWHTLAQILHLPKSLQIIRWIISRLMRSWSLISLRVIKWPVATSSQFCNCFRISSSCQPPSPWIIFSILSSLWIFETIGRHVYEVELYLWKHFQAHCLCLYNWLS